jgi:hypothetical protein
MRKGSIRRSIRPNVDARTWCAGRWGPRRVRVNQCWAVLTAETVYTQMMRDDVTRVRPGNGGSLNWSPGGRSLFIDYELRPNAVWRFGRVFLTCPRCRQRATRIYVPAIDTDPACRRCWGLTYESKKANYRTKGFLGDLFGSWAEADTIVARDRRRSASVARYAERRAILRRLNERSDSPR